MTFDKDSAIVQSYVLLLTTDHPSVQKMSLDDVPDLLNLKEVVEEEVEQREGSKE